MTDNDIVKRLRGSLLPNDTLSIIRDEAADEIERLRQERDEARRDACEFGAMLETDADPNYDPDSGKFAEIAMSIAHLKGWDCWSDYKKETTMTDNDIVSRLNRILSAADERGLDETECRAMQDAIAEIKQLRKERDEARREICETQGYTVGAAHLEAERRGWDCFGDNK